MVLLPVEQEQRDLLRRKILNLASGEKLINLTFKKRIYREK